MATTPFTAWYDEVLPEIPGILPAFALNAIRMAAREFCERSWVWRVDQGPLAVAPGANTYQWEPPENTEPARAIQVWFNRHPLEGKTVGELSDLLGDFMRAEGTPAYFVQDRPDELIIVPKPVQIPPIGITAKLAIKPSRSAVGMETVHADRHFDAIAHGAKARLFRMPRKPWTDPLAAGSYQQMFDDAIAQARDDANKSYGNTRRRVKAQFF